MEIFIIPLIALAVWVLQYVFKTPEDNKQQLGRGGNPAGPRPNVNRPRRQVNDLDRFLEETRRRKQQDESRPVVAEAVGGQPPDRAEAVERERRAQSARPQQPQPARPAPRPERRPPRTPQQTQRRPATSPPRETIPPVMLEAVLVEPIRPAFTPITHPPEPPRETARSRRETTPVVASVKSTVSLGLVDVVQMIRQPRGVLAALVLREIFDPPLSRRR